MLKMIKVALILMLLLSIGWFVYNLPELTKQDAQPVKEAPCEELRWMRDSPQARCVEYWKYRDKIQEV